MSRKLFAILFTLCITILFCVVSHKHFRNDVDDNFYHATVVALAKLGYTKDEIYKICWGNFFELFSKITG